MYVYMYFTYGYIKYFKRTASILMSCALKLLWSVFMLVSLFVIDYKIDL